MSDLAENSGLSQGSVYWYFDSKDSIILNLLEKFFEPELKDLRALLTDSRSAEDRLEIYVDRVSTDMVTMLKWMPLVHDFIALAFRKEQVRKAISRYYKMHLEILLSLIQQGLDAGEFQADNAMEASIAIGSILEGTVLLWVYDPSHIDIKYHIKSNINLLLQGLRTKSSLAKQTVEQNL
jgi:AcrR family transcriptional regulator